MSSFSSLPVTKGSSLEVIYFDWPVPRHIDQLVESSKFVVISNYLPKWRFNRMHSQQPFLSFASPILRLIVASPCNKLQVLSIGNKHLTGFECFNIELLVTKLVIPSISLSIFHSSLPCILPSWYINHLIVWNILQLLLSQ